MLRTTRV